MGDEVQVIRDTALHRKDIFISKRVKKSYWLTIQLFFQTKEAGFLFIISNTGNLNICIAIP